MVMLLTIVHYFMQNSLECAQLLVSKIAFIFAILLNHNFKDCFDWSPESGLHNLCARKKQSAYLGDIWKALPSLNQEETYE